MLCLLPVNKGIDVRREAAVHMWPLSSAEVDLINDSTHLVTPHRANQCLFQLNRVMRGVARLFFVSFLLSLLFLLYQHDLRSRPMMECGAGASREVSPPFVLPDNVTLASLNTTGRAEVDILFFNRVPKVIWNPYQPIKLDGFDGYRWEAQASRACLAN